MRTTTAVIVGAGQAGLAMSRCLTERAIDHVLLERGEVANAWRGRRDSLRLLTPNWQSRLPGYRYRGDDTDGYMTVPEVIDYLRGYADAIDAPVETQGAVTSLEAGYDGYMITTTSGRWRARTVVVASGACNLANIPAFADAVPAVVRSLPATEYRNPGQLDGGGVLVAGASAAGVQLAQEIQRSGRPVTLAVGGHVRVPRVYRGMDIMWWLDAIGVLDERYDQAGDIVRARRLPTFQLIGTPERATIDLSTLQDEGVQLAGRLAGVTDAGIAQFSGSLPNQCSLADLKLRRLLNAIDSWATDHGLHHEIPEPWRASPTVVEESPPLTLDLTAGRARTIIWAIGYRPDYSWLHIPVLDPKGQIRHQGGVTDMPGLYVIGTKFLRRRKSAFIDGASDDARDLSNHLAQHLGSLSVH